MLVQRMGWMKGIKQSSGVSISLTLSQNQTLQAAAYRAIGSSWQAVTSFQSCSQSPSDMSQNIR